MLNIVIPSWAVTTEETEVPLDVKTDIQPVYVQTETCAIVQYKVFRRSKERIKGMDQRNGSQDNDGSLMNTAYFYKNILP